MTISTLRGLAAIFSVSLFLTACGGDSDDTPSTATDTVTDSADQPNNQAAEPTPAPTPTPPPGQAGQLNLGVPTDASPEVTVTTGPGCLLCNVDTPEAVIDGNTDSSALAALNVALLGGGLDSAVSITVDLGTTVDPTVALPLDPEDELSATLNPDQPGFVISFPDVQLVSLSVLPTITIEALSGGEVVGTPASYGYGFFEFLALGIVGFDINNAQVFLSVEDVDTEYDALRISFTSALVDLLINVNVHEVGIHGFNGSIAGDF
jgi:hypothetical protein